MFTKIFLIAGVFQITAISETHVLFQNCPNRCVYDDFLISYEKGFSNLQEGQEVFLKGKVECHEVWDTTKSYICNALNIKLVPRHTKKD